MQLSLPSFQQRFHHRWMHLNDPHVRSLAWLLDAPDLLDMAAPQWQGKIATLGPVMPQTASWLTALDAAPDELHAWLGPAHTRLGLYAEKLMAFYFARQGVLVAHGLQVRDAAGTVGEFDFLLDQHGELLHWEFASKFYLLEGEPDQHGADCFIGPNLADTLGRKVRKIMERQLSLSHHPAAQAVLPQPVARAQALVKGWLFYRGDTPQTFEAEGVSLAHCRGFWRPLGEQAELKGERFMILPRLQWLAPAKAEDDECLNHARLADQLDAHFAANAMPMLVAIMERNESVWLETDRGFIVPDDWTSRAQQRVHPNHR